tara:strand:- start:47 stop:628 length:582 start_codon:yes stop_codon:yes gene_type:complete
MKQPARSFPIPEAIPQEQTTEDQVVVEENINQNPFPEGSQEESIQADNITSPIYMYIYREGFDEVVEKLKEGKDKLPETLGEMAGNLLANELAMSEEEGVDISRDMYVDMQSGIVHQLTEIASEKGLKEFRDDNEAQAFMGEALTYAINTVITGDDNAINDDSWMKMTQDMLRGGVAPDVQPVTGVRVTEEVV